MTKLIRSTSPWTNVVDGFDALPEPYQAAIKMRGYDPKSGEFGATGSTWKDVQAATGVSENRGSLIEMHLRYGHIDVTDMTEGQIKDLIVAERRKGHSWGQISAQTLISESAVRRGYTERSGVDHEGLRTGHGGRFLQGNALAYEGEAAKTGWVRIKDEAQAQATVPELVGSAGSGYERDQLEALKMPALRELFKQSYPDEATPRKKADIIDLLATN